MAVFFPRAIGPVLIDVVVSESAEASMEIPQHPVEKGAKISDHAWRLPQTLSMECLTGDVTGTWRALNDLMAQAEPFDILTGFDLHESMMIKTIKPHRDVTFSQILAVTVEFQEVIIVGTSEGGAAGAGGDERGAGMFNRGNVAATPVDSLPGGLF